MLYSLPDFLAEYGIYLAGVAVLCGVASYFSETFFDNLKKGLIIFAVVFCVAAAYELITGNNIFSLPGTVENTLSELPDKDGKRASNYYRTDKLDEAMYEASRDEKGE